MADSNTHMSAADLWDLVNANTKHASAGVDKGIIGINGASSIIKEDNITSGAYGLYAQRMTNGDSGNITDTSLQHNINTVRSSVSCSDMIINQHKMNSYVYEITNMKNLQDTAIGNFTVLGTVLVKTYDPNLEKHVFVRRQVRVPLFSNLLDPYVIDDRLVIPDGEDSIYKYKIDKDDGDN